MKKLVFLCVVLLVLGVILPSCAPTNSTGTPEEAPPKSTAPTEPEKTAFDILREHVKETGKETTEGYLLSYKDSSSTPYEGQFGFLVNASDELSFVCSWPERNCAITIELFEGVDVYVVRYSNLDTEQAHVDAKIQLDTYTGSIGKGITDIEVYGNQYISDDLYTSECERYLLLALSVLSEKLPEGVTLKELGFTAYKF